MTSKENSKNAEEKIPSIQKISYPQEYEKYFEWLDDLRRSGITNMFGARPYLQNEFGFDQKEATAVLSLWMKTFSQRHPDGDRKKPSEPDEDYEDDEDDEDDED